MPCNGSLQAAAHTTPPGSGLGWASSLSPKAAVASTLLKSHWLASGPQFCPQAWGLMHRPVSTPLGAPADRWPSPGHSAVQAQNPVAPVVWPLHRPAACFHVPQ
jgi:hypothetical protein